MGKAKVDLRPQPARMSLLETKVESRPVWTTGSVAKEVPGKDELLISGIPYGTGVNMRIGAKSITQANGVMLSAFHDEHPEVIGHAKIEVSFNIKIL